MNTVAALAGDRERADSIVTGATIRAAALLDVPNKALAAILGLSEPTVSRMKRGGYLLREGQKPFELAVLFIRLYRSLDAIVGGEDATARRWLISRNDVLGETPLAHIETIAGLLDVIQYLDARRAVV